MPRIIRPIIRTRLERGSGMREVNLSEGSFIDNSMNVCTVCFLIVAGKTLGASPYALFLFRPWVQRRRQVVLAFPLVGAASL
jgi:hypothetical protein